MEEVFFKNILLLYLGTRSDDARGFAMLIDGQENLAITVKQPYASMLVAENKKFEYRNWKLRDNLTNHVIFIHAGKQVLKKKVHVSEREYNQALRQVEERNLFGCIVGCVTFGQPEKRDDGYAWPVLNFYRFSEPIRNVKGHLGIWKFKVSNKRDEKHNGNPQRK